MKGGKIAPTLLSGESPILLINVSFMDKLKKRISCTGEMLETLAVFYGSSIIRETTKAKKTQAEEF